MHRATMNSVSLAPTPVAPEIYPTAEEVWISNKDGQPVILIGLHMVFSDLQEKSRLRVCPGGPILQVVSHIKSHSQCVIYDTGKAVLIETAVEFLNKFRKFC